MMRRLTNEETRKFIKDMYHDSYDSKYMGKDLDELFDLATKTDRLAILMLLYWEDWERKKGESADKHKLARFESILRSAMDDIQHDDQLLLKRAFWQTKNLR